MAENEGAIQNDAGSSPVPAEIGGLVSTVEFHSPKPADTGTEPEGAKNTKGTDKQPAGKEAEGGKTDPKEAAAKPSGDDDRFDKHPRFQELNRRVKESVDRISRLEAENAQLKSSKAAPEGDKGKGDGSTAPYKDVSKMKPEELLDWQSEDPQGYYANLLAQAKHEISGDLNRGFEQRQKEDAVVSTYENFAKANPDFDEMWDSGTLQEFMRGNPGHNAISAYHSLTADSKLKAATEKAAKDAEAAFTRNQRAKRVSDVLPQGPSAPGVFTNGDDALKDSKKFGGTTAVLAQRLADRRRNQAGM